MLSQLISLNKRIVFQWIPFHCGILGNENADALAKKGSTATYKPVTKSTYYSVKRFIKSSYLDFNKQNLITQSQGEKWNSLHQNPQLIPDLPRKSSVAAFRLATGHDCLAKHLHIIGIYQSPNCPLCNSNQEMDSEHLKICASVAGHDNILEKYWSARGYGGWINLKNETQDRQEWRNPTCEREGKNNGFSYDLLDEARTTFRGMVVEQGSHNELLALRGHYHALVNADPTMTHGHIAVWEIQKMHNVSWETGGKKTLREERRRWEDNKMDLMEVGYDDRDWINLAMDRDKWRAYDKGGNEPSGAGEGGIQHQENGSANGVVDSLAFRRQSTRSRAGSNKDQQLSTPLIEEEQYDAPLTRIIALNKPEWLHVLVGCIAAAAVGFTLPLFAILFGEVYGNTPILCMFMVCAMEVPCVPSLNMNDAFRTEGYHIEEYLLSVGLDERLGIAKERGNRPYFECGIKNSHEQISRAQFTPERNSVLKQKQVLSVQDPEEVQRQTNWYCILFVVIGVVTGLGMFLQMHLFSLAGVRLTARLRVAAFSAMLRQEIGWFDEEKNGVGILCARLSGDAASVQGVNAAKGYLSDTGGRAINPSL
ncbi:hypothetical protein ANN_03658 [Periplaneta americana]|uniref:ABC transmembrane type-1 domain-containing protein n=1 Tax=Periplaneta americana TaxID=6978 RepID=A0ABQ8TZM7_PERAM|nr:hypothetical protein ANN_03658 [Periplaneta americana]